MKVTKEWLLKRINLIPDGTEIDITGHDYGQFIRLGVDYQEPKRAEWPPNNVSRCTVNGVHMWGYNECRHCGVDWPEPFRSNRVAIDIENRKLYDTYQSS